MKYYKDKDNVIYAYDAYGWQDSFIKEGLILITRSEAMAIINLPPHHTLHGLRLLGTKTLVWQKR